MASFDLTVRNGTVATASDTFQADIGVKDGRIAAIGTALAPGTRDLDARGRLVLPGGVDSHCHVEQLSSAGVMCADDFYSATVAAAFGGTTTIIPFAAQHRGHSILAVVDDYARRAAEKAVIDYGFHLIIADPNDKAMNEELPAAIRRGITSFKVYMTYDLLRLTDDQLLDVLAVAARERTLVMVHAENHEIIKWIAKRLLARGHGAPKFHMTSHHPIAEAEATNRVIQLSRLLDVPVLIVHVSGIEAVQTIRAAQTLGALVYAETCPQYLFLKATDADKPGLEGAKWCCSPPPRDEASQEAVWKGLADGTFQVLSSDHAPYRFDETGKLPKGEKTTFKEMANGVPGLQVRLPLALLGRRGQGPADPEPVRRAHRDESRAHVRAASAQGHDRGRFGRRPRALGAGTRSDAHRGDDERQRRLHALRGHAREGLADDGREPRARRGRGWRAESRARLGRVHSARGTGTGAHGYGRPLCRDGT